MTLALDPRFRGVTTATRKSMRIEIICTGDEVLNAGQDVVDMRLAEPIGMKAL